MVIGGAIPVATAILFTKRSLRSCFVDCCEAVFLPASFLTSILLSEISGVLFQYEGRFNLFLFLLGLH